MKAINDVTVIKLTWFGRIKALITGKITLPNSLLLHMAEVLQDFCE